MATYTNELEIKNNLNIEALLKKLSNKNKGFASKIRNTFYLIKIYSKAKELDYLRKIIENYFVNILENKYKGNIKEFFNDMKSIAFLPPKIKEMYEEDLEEAIDTYKMKILFKENEDKLKKLFNT
jgi:hypothetical protein